jgi:hypothetical protein
MEFCFSARNILPIKPVQLPYTVELIGTESAIVENILCSQYRDAVKENNEQYERKMKGTLRDWCGETDWNVVKYRLNL